MIQIPQLYLEKKSSLFESAMSNEPQIVPDPPAELSLFRSLPREEKFKASEKFYAQDFVQEYLELKWKAELHNRTCFLFLWEGYKRITNREKKDRLEVKLVRFKNVIRDTDHPFKALRINMNEYHFGVQSQVESDVVDMFQGKIVHK